MAVYYLVYVEREGLPVLIGIHTDENKAYDLLRFCPDSEKWVNRVKTDASGKLV